MKVTMDSQKCTSVRLKRRLDNGPTEHDITSLRKQISELRFQLAQATSVNNVRTPIISFSNRSN